MDIILRGAEDAKSYPSHIVDKFANDKIMFEVEDDPDKFTKLNDDVERLTLGDIETLLAKFCIHGFSREFVLDPEVVSVIDEQVDYKVFIIGTKVFNRETIYQEYPFKKMGLQPEMFCSRIYLNKGTSSGLRGLTTDSGFTIVKAPFNTADSIPTKLYIKNHKWEKFESLSDMYSILHYREYAKSICMEQTRLEIENKSATENTE